MATVYFTSSLTPFTGGLEMVTIDAPRVVDLIAALTARFPDLAEPLEQMAVAIDGEIHDSAPYQPLSATSEIHWVPRMAGG